MGQRHEDDLRAEAYANGGAVTLDSLLEHMQLIVAHPEAHGTSVTEPLRALLNVMEHLVIEGDGFGIVPDRAFLRTRAL